MFCLGAGLTADKTCITESQDKTTRGRQPTASRLTQILGDEDPDKALVNAYWLYVRDVMQPSLPLEIFHLAPYSVEASIGHSSNTTSTCSISSAASHTHLRADTSVRVSKSGETRSRPAHSSSNLETSNFMQAIPKRVAFLVNPLLTFSLSSQASSLSI